MSYFEKIEQLRDLEEKGKWNQARELLLGTWENDKENSGKLVRVVSECWLVLSWWDCCISTNGLSFQDFQNTLIECVEFGLKHFSDDTQFLCVAGHMIATLPFLFYSSEAVHLYSEWEQRGVDMIRKAHELDSDDWIAKILNLGLTLVSLDEHILAKGQFLPNIEKAFPGETELEKYFRDLLSP